MLPIGLKIKRLSNYLSRCVDNLESVKKLDELTGNNNFIIKYLIDNENKVVTQKDIEQAFGITRSTTSKVLSLMEKKNLIIRDINEADSRSKVIKITDKGKEISQIIDEELVTFEKIVIKGFSSKELETLNLYLERIKNNLKEEYK